MRSKKMILMMILITLILNWFNFSYKVEATTNGYTPDTAIEYVKSLIDQTIDMDGIYPGECVDLIMKYEKELSGTYFNGNGADYVYNGLPDGWTRLQNGTPQKGDILVYTGGYGHVAIYESDNITYHQNYNWKKR